MTPNGEHLPFPNQRQKMNRARLLNEFWDLNRKLKRKPYPMPKIREILLNLEVFQYAISLDLNMGYDHIRLSEEASNLCTIILPLVHNYQRVQFSLVFHNCLLLKKVFSIKNDR